MSTTTTTDVGAEPAPAADQAVDASAPPTSPAVPRHPLLAAAIGLLIVASFGTFGLEPKAFIAAFAGSALLILAAIDLVHRVLPNRILFGAFVVVLVAQVGFFPERGVEWLLAGPAAAAFLAMPLIVRRDAMGLGDVKLALLLGAIVGWKVFVAIVIGCFAMLPFAVLMLVRDRSIKGATLPFGPFLAFGTLVVLFTS